MYCFGNAELAVTLGEFEQTQTGKPDKVIILKQFGFPLLGEISRAKR